MSVAIRFVSIGMFFGLAAFSASLSSADIRNRHIETVGKRMLNSLPVADSYVKTVYDSREFHDALAGCRSTNLENALSIQLKVLDVAIKQGDRNEQADVLAKAGTLIRHIESCNPASSNAWLRDAMIASPSGKEIDYIIDRMTMASLLNPFYQAEVEARMSFWSYAPQDLTQAGKLLIRQDLSTVLLYFSIRDAKAVISQIPSAMRPQLIDALSIVNADRRAKLLSAGK